MQADLKCGKESSHDHGSVVQRSLLQVHRLCLLASAALFGWSGELYQSLHMCTTEGLGVPYLAAAIITSLAEKY